jgi:hypothetical protein
VAWLEQPDPRAAWRSSAAAACAECGRELEELLLLRGNLDRLGERIQLDACSGLEGEELVERVLGPRLRTRARRSFAAWWILGAAAAAAVVLIRLLPRDPEPGATMLGPPRLVLHPPAPGAATFTWTAVLPEGGWYEVSVLGSDGHVLSRTTVEDSRWTPDSTSGWPSPVRLRVAVFDRSGVCVDRHEEPFSLSAP